MQSSFSSDFPVICPFSQCPSHPPSGCEGPSLGLKVQKRGFFYRKETPSLRIHRWGCSHCRRTFSRSTLEPEWRQKKRECNLALYRLMTSAVSGRRAARLLGVSRGWVARRLISLGRQAWLEHERELKERASLPPEDRIAAIQFDEMETFEHTKLKPLSIALAVEDSTRRILGISLASMPCGGPLAEMSRKKYGLRKDERKEKAQALFESLQPVVHPERLTIKTDQKTVYPHWLRPFFPQMTHEAHKGRRGCVVGQGELKKIGFDPLFSLNHTAAMFRANVNRLFRRTWCTTKKPERLLAHLYLYVRYHNTVLIPKLSLIS